MKTQDAVESFHLFKNSYKLSPRFSPGYEGTDNMFYFFYKIIIFRLNKEKYEARTENFQILKTANHIAQVIFVLHSACRPIKIHVLSKLFYKTR